MHEKVKEVNEQQVLAKVRTLLALERNYLAEERTALAEFRTGLALMFIGPTVGTIIAYVLSILAVDQSIFLDIINLTFFFDCNCLGSMDNFSITIQIENNWKKEKSH